MALVQALVASPLKRPPSLHVMAQMANADEGSVVITRGIAPFSTGILAGNQYG
jgi:hypothetical protein